VSVRRTWGASRTLSDRASGSGARARYWAHSYRPDPSSNEAWILSAAFQAEPVAVAFRVTFTSHSLTARFSFSAESIPRDARQRHGNSRSVFNRIFG
jgi:hypothetical protein